MANPFDQFDAAPSSSPSDGNPFDQFDAKATPAQKTAAPAQKASGSLVTDVILSALDYGSLGLVKKNPFMAMPESLSSDIAQAHQNLGWADPAIGAAAYMLGPGKILGPAAAAAGYGTIGTAALEGAMAGGISSADPTNLVGTLEGAAGGAVLGGAGGVAAKGIGAALGKGAPAVDAAAVVASTKAARDQAYAPFKQMSFTPRAVTGVYANAGAGMTPGMIADITPGFKATVGRQLDQIGQGTVTGDDILDYARNLRDAASPSSNGDKVLANRIADNLESFLPQDQLAGAKQAHQQYTMAQNLQDWQRNLQDFGIGPGGAPVKQAEFYKPGSDEYNALAQIYKTDSAGGSYLPYILSHATSEVGGGLGGMAAGFPGMVVGGTLGHMTKPLFKGAGNALARARLMKQLQGAYPTLTGVTPPTTPSGAPQVGNLIKGLLFSQGSQYGY